MAKWEMIYLGIWVTVLGWWTGYCFPKKAKLPVPLANPDTRFCRDCRYLLRGRNILGFRTSLTFARCSHITSIREPGELLVRGHLNEDNMGYASVQRKTGVPTLAQFLPPERLAEFEIPNPSNCGPQGRYWERA
jgi:hypothetical protein